MTGSFAASLPVSSSSSGMGYRKPTEWASGDEDRLVERLEDDEPMSIGGRRDLNWPSTCGMEFGRGSGRGNWDAAGDAIVTIRAFKTAAGLKDRRGPAVEK